VRQDLAQCPRRDDQPDQSIQGEGTETVVISEADAVVIGAGASGCSTAYHLSKLGLKRVALVDKRTVSSQTSQRAAGLSGQIRDDDQMTRLIMRSNQKIVNFTAETGEPLEVFVSGSLRIARLPQHVEQLKEDVERGQRLGLDIDFVSPRRAQELMPVLETKGILAATFTKTDLYLEPRFVPIGYARAAQKLGATLCENMTVTGITTHDGAIESVETDQGTIRTPVVVDCAGAWARVIGESIGIDVPIVPTRHQLYITEPVSDVQPKHAITRIVDANVYVRPDKGGLMLGGYESDPKQYDVGALPSSFDMKDLDLDFGVLRGLAAKVREQLPIFEKLEVQEHRGGLPTMTADGHHLLGPLPAPRGFYVLTGCVVSGLTSSPILGELLAQWIIGGEPPTDLSLMRADRFVKRPLPADELKQLCRTHYAYRYWRKLPVQ
jgi:glycine/D-amino acid oxidase-like deaminating enzyme